jgi:hypothetical protein
VFRARPEELEARPRALAVAAGALLVPICLVYLWYPGDADEALFELGARRLAAGEVIYRDFWDIKQPGIYWFYQAGLSLGLGVVGPRLLEIAGVLLGGWPVWRLSGGWRLNPLVRVISPALVLGSYLLLTHRGGVAEIEGLCNPLLVAVFVATWPADPTGGPPRSVPRWLLAGVAVGVIGTLKTFYLPIPLVLLVGALVASRSTLRGRLVRAGAAVGGLLIPLAVATGYFAAHGALELAWVTTVRVPLESAGTLAEGWSRWLELVVGLSGLLILPAMVALVTARRRGTVVRELTLAGTILICLLLAVQQFPTPYRLLVLVAPLGLLAMVGADVVARRVERAGTGLIRRRVLALALVAVLALPLLRGPQRLVFMASQLPSWGLGQDQRNARDFVMIGQPLDRDAEPVRGLIPPGSAIYVIGHPQLYQLLRAREAIEINGWGIGLMPDRVWDELDRELVRSRPQWIFIENDYVADLNRQAPATAAMLAAQYRPVASTPLGVWYRTATPGRPSGIPGDNQLARQT